ncbi:MAG: lytic transglycosylase domain-containing protein [Vampirovibrionales bacterium]|nr:lytic transglycosylase domain-containing protein [Vampirovibrionales bacterium]
MQVAAGIQSFQSSGGAAAIEGRVRHLEGMLNAFEAVNPTQAGFKIPDGATPFQSGAGSPLAGFQTQGSALDNANNLPFADNIQSACNRYGVDPLLVQSLIKQESAFNPQAVSKSGALGLMQLMPGTAKALGVQNAMDPAQNIAGGTLYLSRLLKNYSNNIPLALAAYNAGPGAVAKYDGVPPYAETQQYVKNVLGNYLRAQAEQGHS